MGIVPTGFSGVAKTQPQQKAFEAIAGANQVADGFIFLVGHMDGRQFAGAIEAGQLVGIPPVGLDAVGSLFGNERRTDQVAVSAFAAQVTTQNKAAGPGLIDEVQLEVGFGESFEEVINGLECSANNAVAADLGGVLGSDGDGNGIFVDVQANVMHDFLHGCLVSLHGY